MTTIVACKSTLSVAADSRVTTVDSKTGETQFSSRCYKIWRTRKYIIGAAGVDNEITILKHWLRDTSRPRRWGGEPLSALLLSRTKLFYIDDGSGLEEVADDYYAVGTGSQFALASMNTQQRLGHVPDVELAVLVACDHDNESGPPPLVVRWAPARGKQILTPEGVSSGNSPEAF